MPQIVQNDIRASRPGLVRSSGLLFPVISVVCIVLLFIMAPPDQPLEPRTDVNKVPSPEPAIAPAPAPEEGAASGVK